MLIVTLTLLPALTGLLAFFIDRPAVLRLLLLLTAVIHLLLTLSTWIWPAPPIWSGWLALDALGQLYLTCISVLFAAVAFYAVGYIGAEQLGNRPDFEDKRQIFSNAPESIFFGCLLLFLTFMSFACVCQHFGLFWVAIESTTLVSAPLIYFHRHRRSLEATWKYLMICSVGIALALLGYLFLAVGAPGISTDDQMLLESLKTAGPGFHLTWLRGAFILFLVGYGTKMGLAPMHTWKPDTYAEAPSLVSALMSGGLSLCAFLGILRVLQVCQAAGEGPFAQNLLVILGLLSIGVAAVFLVAQVDYKRMLAYSSIEHMGIMALGAGLGGIGCWGALFHGVGHTLVKGLLFLVAGNILAAYHTRDTSEVRGVLGVAPTSGALWITGFLAITGAPPFSLFISELSVLKAALDQGRSGVAAVYLLLLAIIFVGMASVVLRMAQGTPPAGVAPVREARWQVVPPVILLVLALLLGVVIPPPLQEVLKAAALSVGG